MKASLASLNTSLTLLMTLLVTVKCQLVINVSSGEPDANVYRESVTGNLSSETVTIEFLTTAGLGVVQVTDFRAGLTITSVTVPGEEELGEPEYQVLCFVTPGVGDMIPPEAVTKLRQKHPGSVRVAEESRGRLVVDNSASLVVTKAGVMSEHVPRVCREARETTFTPEHLLSQVQEGAVGARKGIKKDPSVFSKYKAGEYSALERCAGLEPGGQEGPCLCVLEVCVLWYPCSLKYCRNTGGDTAGEHRCGIRTCTKCSDMRFTAKSRHACSWDEI